MLGPWTTCLRSSLMRPKTSWPVLEVFFNFEASPAQANRTGSAPRQMRGVTMKHGVSSVAGPRRKRYNSLPLYSIARISKRKLLTGPRHRTKWDSRTLFSCRTLRRSQTTSLLPPPAGRRSSGTLTGNDREYKASRASVKACTFPRRAMNVSHETVPLTLAGSRFAGRRQRFAPDL
jgi:hypothetical protein